MLTDQTYQYQVTANNSIGESAPSNDAITPQLGMINLNVNTDQPRYVKWSYVYVNVTVLDEATGTPLQDALVNATVSDPYGRVVWSNNGVTDNNGKIHFVYKLIFDAHMGNYIINVSVSLNGYFIRNGTVDIFQFSIKIGSILSRKDASFYAILR